MPEVRLHIFAAKSSAPTHGLHVFQQRWIILAGQCQRASFSTEFVGGAFWKLTTSVQQMSSMEYFLYIEERSVHTPIQHQWIFFKDVWAALEISWFNISVLWSILESMPNQVAAICRANWFYSVHEICCNFLKIWRYIYAHKVNNTWYTRGSIVQRPSFKCIIYVYFITCVNLILTLDFIYLQFTLRVLPFVLTPLDSLCIVSTH